MEKTKVKLDCIDRKRKSLMTEMTLQMIESSRNDSGVRRFQ